LLSEVRKIQEEEHPEWAFDCPQRIRVHAIEDAVGAVKNAKAKYRKTGTFQEVSWRAKKDPKQRFGFDKVSFEDDFVFSKHQDRIFYTSPEGGRVEMEGTEVVFENGRWFAILPQRRCVLQPENQRQPIVALDPGVRTFMSLYGFGVYGDFGKGDFGRIRRLCYHLDELQGKIAKSKRRQRQRMKKASQRLRWRIRDLVDDLHKKLAYFLVTRFDVILLPTFETQQMVSKLHSKTARAMMTWAHYRFKQHLKAKAEEYSAVVVGVNEAYTSKTCSYCGTIQNIGSKKRFRCSCGVDVDRDHQGARGILLRALSVTTSPTADCMVNKAWKPSQVLHLLAKR
jgi:putative transposase